MIEIKTSAILSILWTSEPCVTYISCSLFDLGGHFILVLVPADLNCSAVAMGIHEKNFNQKLD